MIGIYYDNLHILDNKIIKLDQTINIWIRSNIRKLPPQKKEKHKEISLNKRQQIHKTYLIGYNKKIRVKNTYLHDCR